MTSQTATLEGIRSSLAKSAPFEPLYQHLQPSPVSSPLPTPDFSTKEVADRFSKELAAVGGEIHRVATEEQAAATVGSILREIGAKRVAISDIDLFGQSVPNGIEIIVNPSRDELFAVEAGVSTAQLAIAETGTLVLRSSIETHRLVSLVPPIHICVLNSADIRPSMHMVLEEVSNKIDPTITFITGPSRTSDIELTLAIGVHGPKRLIVVLID
jgi:L-lactate dehydrogenase complex protein LldG